MHLAFIKSLPRLLAQQKTIFFVSSVLSRLVWAGTIVYLASSLAADEYGEFSFWTITAGSLSAVIFGGFANSFAYEQSKTQIQSGITTSPSVYGTYAGVHFFGFFIAANVILYSVSQEIDFRDGALVAGLATSLTLSTLAISHMCALGFFLTAASCAALGPLAFIFLSLLYSDGTSEQILLFSFVSNILSFAPAAFVARSQIENSRDYFAQSIDLLRLHGRSLRVGLANLPVQGSMLILAAALMADQGAAVFAEYGLANQLIGVLLFIPTALAPIFLTKLPQWESSQSIGRIFWIWCGLLFFVTLSPIAIILAAIYLCPDWIEPIFLTAAWTGVVATIAASFVASRSPFAWLNQARNRYGAEWTAGLVTSFTIVVAILFVDMRSSEMAMSVRLIAAALSLFVSVAIYWFLRRQLEV